VMDVVYYPDEGHGFDKLEHQIDAARAASSDGSIST
jgi:dipeptidyl aminopeptidase/acylaminoacyl peptidase